jgi:hypothetical protein
MTTYTWQYSGSEGGSPFAFTVVYNDATATNNVTVTITEGALEINQFWFTDLDGVANEFAPPDISTSDPALTINGEVKAKLDGFQLIDPAGLGEENNLPDGSDPSIHFLDATDLIGSNDSFTVTAGEAFIKFLANANGDTDLLGLGIRATSVNAGGSLKLIDTPDDDDGGGGDSSVTFLKDTICPGDGESVENGNVLVGKDVTWQYTVINDGKTALYNVAITDDNGTPLDGSDDFQVTLANRVSDSGNGDDILDVGETWVFEYAGTAQLGEGGEDDYFNTAHLSSNAGSAEGTPLTDEADSGFHVLNPVLTLNKTTEGTDKNGVSHNDDGIQVEAGTLVTWHYAVTNDGNVDLSGINLVDDNGTSGNSSDDFLPTYVDGDDGDGILQVGETWNFTTSSLAKAGPYANTATVTANDVEDDCDNTAPVSDDDTSSYTGQFTPGPSGLTIGYWYNHLTTPTKGTPSGPYADQFLVTNPAGAPTGGDSAGKYLLMGDENGDRQANDAHNVWVAFDVVKELINSSQTANDTRQILFSQAIATQLNIDWLGGGPRGLATDAADWLDGGGGDSTVDAGIFISRAIYSGKTYVSGDYDMSAHKLLGTVLTSNQAGWQSDLNLKAEDFSNNNSGNLFSQYSPDSVRADGDVAFDMNGEGLKNALQAYNQGTLNVSADKNSLQWASGDFAVVENDPGNYIALLDHEAHILPGSSLLKGVDII